MESPMLECKNVEVTIHTSTSSSSNQFIPDNLELPDDTFRMSLDNFSMVGENVTIGRGVSVDSSVAGIAYTPTIELQSPLPTPDLKTPDIELSDSQTPDIATPEVQTPGIETPDLQNPDFQTPNIEMSENKTQGIGFFRSPPEVETPDIETLDVHTPDVETPDVQTPAVETPDVQTSEIETPDVQTPPPEDKTSPPILETPKQLQYKVEMRRPQTLMKLSLTKKSDNDLFVKPSPVAELMSPARMLQFEVEPSSATPTMKRAAVDFDFFSKHKFEEYFEGSEPKEDKRLEDPVDGNTYKETPVIVKADTVRHEIGYGK